ncbi:MAG: hypothetical protein ACRCWP_12090, partial [Shewanella sp.]
MRFSQQAIYALQTAQRINTKTLCENGDSLRMRSPTDLEVLERIYSKYYQDFTEYEDDENIRASKIYVPISCDEIAKKLKVDGDIVFGRLYYHMEKKYGYKQSDGSNVHFFAFRVGKESHCVNFPLLSSVL